MSKTSAFHIRGFEPPLVFHSGDSDILIFPSCRAATSTQKHTWSISSLSTHVPKRATATLETLRHDCFMSVSTSMAAFPPSLTAGGGFRLHHHCGNGETYHRQSCHRSSTIRATTTAVEKRQINGASSATAIGKKHSSTSRALCSTSTADL